MNAAHRTVQAARKVAESHYGGWTVRAFFGAFPDESGEPTSVAYSACATTPNLQQSRKPALLGIEDAILVKLGERGVLWIRAATRSDLTRKLKLALNGFRWGATE